MLRISAFLLTATTALPDGMRAQASTEEELEEEPENGGTHVTYLTGKAAAEQADEITSH